MLHTRFMKSVFECPNRFYSSEVFPRNYWNDDNNQRKFIESASSQLNIKQLDDWYKITRKVSFSPFHSTNPRI